MTAGKCYFCRVKNPLRLVLLAFATLLLTTQCDHPDEPVPPAKLMSREQLISLLVDLHITESRVEASRLPPDSAKVLFRELSKPLYGRHQADEQTFRQSMDYYAVHGKDLEEIYAGVVDSIAARQAKLQSPSQGQQ